MTDLADFLSARIAEDRAAVPGEPFGDKSLRTLWPAPGDVRVLDHRWVAECEAKRRIVRLYQGALEHGTGSTAAWLHSALETLALLYADHPDFREEWRP